MTISGSRSILSAAAIVVAVLTVAPRARAATDPEAACQKSRYAALAKYAACEAKAIASLSGLFPVNGKQTATIAKCRVKYAAAWVKMQGKALGTGSTCDHPRFDTTSAPGTAIDRLTGLQWTQTTDDGTIRDKDETYTWSSVPPSADGTLFTTFLATLDSSPCFAGHCDWRLPTRAELQTMFGSYPCPDPCVDTAVFGPAAAPFAHWSSTTNVWNDGNAWYVNTFGEVGATGKFSAVLGRAVRGGL